MRKIKVQLNIGMQGRREDVLEIEDDYTEQEIQNEVEMWAWSYIDWGWEEVE